MSKDFIILVGPPGSGKSTLIDKIKEDNPDVDFFVASSDDIYEEWGKPLGLNYTESFNHFEYNDVMKEFNARLDAAFKDDKSIIVDRTNMGKKPRKKLIRRASNKGYTIKAIAFELSREIIDERLLKRAEETGKAIPKFVVDRMISSYTRPDVEEGFDSIEIIKK